MKAWFKRWFGGPPRVVENAWPRSPERSKGDQAPSTESKRQLVKHAAPSNEAPCPYCHEPIRPVPTRKRKCPHCKKTIHVKRRPDEGEKRPVTKEEAEEIERQWRERQRDAGFVRDLSQFGCSERDGERLRHALEVEFGQPPANDDVVWRAANELVSKSIGVQDWGMLRITYFRMALLLQNRGQDGFAMAQESCRAALREFAANGFDQVAIDSTGGCAPCRKLARKRFTLERALREMPIPVRDCKWDQRNEGGPGWCRCMYTMPD